MNATPTRENAIVSVPGPRDEQRTRDGIRWRPGRMNSLYPMGKLSLWSAIRIVAAIRIVEYLEYL